MTHVGEFAVVSSKVHITDPCYNRDTWCAIFNLPAKNGKWFAKVDYRKKDDWGERVWEVMAKHESIANKSDNNLKWGPIDADIGVDSGQCGIFCDSIYPSDDQRRKDGDKSIHDLTHFYGKCCMQTLSKREGGLHHGNYGLVDNAGVVVSSGYGDGSYNAFGVYKGKELVAVKVNFEGYYG